MKETERQESLANLAIAERFRKTAERVSPERKGYSIIYSVETKKMLEALEKKDFKTIFSLEKTYQEHDANFRTPDNEKPKEYMGLIPTLEKRFEEFSNPENVKEHFKTTVERLKNKSGIKDAAFNTPINSMSGYIGSMMSNYAPPAINNFLSTRITCLSAVKDEHQVHIDVGLGIAKGKEKSKDLGR